MEKKQGNTALWREENSGKFFSHLAAHYRQANRKDVRIRCNVEIVLLNKRVFDSGRAVIRNVSSGGALLEQFKTKKQVIPLNRFRIRLQLFDKEFEGITIFCEPVRIQTDEKFSIGVKFRDISVAV